jgi:hypothetical protein
MRPASEGNGGMVRNAEIEAYIFIRNLSRYSALRYFYMSVKLLALVHWFITLWPYVVGTIIALFFVLLKGLPVLHEWFSVFILGWNTKRLGLSNKLQDDPQLALIDDDGMQHPRVRGKAINRKSWLVKIGIMNFCIGFVALIVWLFGR